MISQADLQSAPSVDVATDPSAAFDTVMAALTAQGVRVDASERPNGVRFTHTEKHWWYTNGQPVRYFGQAVVTDLGGGRSRVAVALKLDGSSATTAWLIAGALVLTPLLIGAVLPFAMLFLLAGLANLGSVAYHLLSQAPQKTSQTILANLGPATPSSGYAPAPTTQAPPPVPPVAPPPPPPAPAAVPTRDSDGDPMERIRRLAELRDAGAISAEEFEAKKAELLARI